MPLTGEQRKRAEAAQRMLADEAFVGVLWRIRDDATQQAVFDPEPLAREAQRQLVLAIVRILGELQYDADLPEAVKASDILAKGFE